MGADMSRPSSVHRLRNSQAGFTLIEVLVAILICSFGLLGIVGLQSRAMQYSVSAEDSGRAIMLANEITTEMYTLKTINLPTSVTEPWQIRVATPSAGGLPRGRGTVEVDGRVATVTIQWQTHGPSSPVNQYVTQLSF
jgi:type IV pilus assembly protein PilV